MIEEGFIPTGIPDDGPDMDQILLEETGRELSDISREDVTRSPAWLNGSQEQVAGLPGVARRLFLRKSVNAPRTDLLLKAGQDATQRPPEPPEGLSDTLDQLVTPEPVSPGEPTGVPGEPSPGLGAAPERGPTPFDSPETLPEDYPARLAAQAAAEERRTWARNINLDYVESEQDIGKVLDLNAEILGEVEHRSFSEVEAADIRAELAPVLQGKQNGLLTDKQLYAGRRLLVTMTERVQSMLDGITEGRATDQEKLEFDKLISQTVMLQKYMQGQIRETARALSAMRINARALNARNTDAILETLNAPQTDIAASVVVKAQIMRDALAAREGDDAAAVVTDAAAGMYDKNTIRALANFWSASILTGFKTQATNLVSNFFVQVLETGVLKPMAAGIGGVRRGIMRSDEGVGFDEAYFDGLGAFHAFRDATLMAYRVFANGVRSGEYTSSYGQRKIDDITRQAPTLSQAFGMSENVAGKSVDLYQRMVEAGSYGLLTAGDEFFKTIAYRKSLYSLAARQGFEQGKRGQELTDHINAKLNDLDDFDVELHEGALAEAERQTFTNSPEGSLGILGKQMRGAIQKIPALKFIMPFIDTPLNLFNYALEIGPTAPLTASFRKQIQAGGAQRDIALAQLTFGVTAATVIAMMHQQTIAPDGSRIAGTITGGGPKNFGQRKALDRMGWKPYSIRIGDTYYPYNRGTDPLGMMLSGITGYLDRAMYAREESTASQMFVGAVFSMAAYAKDATYLRGIGEIMKAIDNQGVGVDRYAARMLVGFAPRAFGTYQEMTSGDIVRTTYPSSGFWDALSKQMDSRFDKEELNPLRYWDGEIVTHGGGVALHIFNSISPINPIDVKNDPASRVLVENGVSVLPPTPVITVMGVQIDLLQSDKGDELYDKYLEMVGKHRRKMVEVRLNHSGFKKMAEGPGSAKYLELQKALAQGRRIGANEFSNYLFDKVGKNIEEYGDIAQYFDKKALANLIRRAKAGTLTIEQEESMQDMKIRGARTREGIPAPAPIGF